MHQSTRSPKDGDDQTASNEPNIVRNAFRDLAEHIRDAYQERCEQGCCDCVTYEENERNLKRR